MHRYTGSYLTSRDTGIPETLKLLLKHYLTCREELEQTILAKLRIDCREKCYIFCDRNAAQKLKKNLIVVNFMYFLFHVEL